MLGDVYANYGAKRKNENLTIKELASKLPWKRRIKVLAIVYFYQAVEGLTRLIMIASLIIAFYFSAIHFNCVRAFIAMLMTLVSSQIYSVVPKIK